MDIPVTLPQILYIYYVCTLKCYTVFHKYICMIFKSYDLKL